MSAKKPPRKNARDRHQIQQADALVVLGQQPGPDAVVDREVVLGRRRRDDDRRGRHGPAASTVPSDLMYSIRSRMPSSVTSPLNVGMIASYPCTMSVAGSRMDRRR